MNLIKQMHITIGGPGGSSYYHNEAIMLQYLLKQAGIENVVIEDKYPEYIEQRHDNELKLFMGAKPDKITIRVEHYPWGG